jgi:hypothetical protein
MKETRGSDQSDGSSKAIIISRALGHTSLGEESSLVTALGANKSIHFNIKRYCDNGIGVRMRFSSAEEAKHDPGLTVVRRSRDMGYDDELVGTVGSTLFVGRENWIMTILDVGNFGVTISFIRYPYQP